MRKIKVIILAGGIGKRMWPIRASKSLLPFFGELLLLHILKTIKKGGLNDFILVANPAIFNQVKKLTAPFKAQVVLQSKPLGQADAILKTAKFIKDQEVLVVNASDIFEPGLIKKILLRTKSEGSDAALPAVIVKDYFPGGYLAVKNKKIIKVVEKPSPGKEPSNLVKLDIDYFRNASRLLEALRKTKSQRDDIFEVAINKMIKQGLKFTAVEYEDYWGSIKYPWDILKAMQLFFKYRWPKRKGRKPTVARPATIIEPVIFEEGVRIFEGAKIKGPAYIGAGTIIGNGALVRESMIGKNCVIGYSTDVVRSYLGDDCWLHSNYIGDSVLGDNVSFGAGAVTANLRLDEGEISSVVGREKIATGLEKLGAIIGDNVRIGVNASIMPGLKIGADSFIGAGVVLYKDLPENKFCLLNQSLSISRNKKSVASKTREKFKKKI